MMSSAGWRELPRRSKSECPKLFYRVSTDDDHITIKLTDLVAIWECSLDRNAVIEAAREQEASIDPSESNAQFRVLLEKLEQSIDAGNNVILRADSTAGQRVHLKTRLELPRPLKALAWTFDLEPQDAGELAEQLLRPCLHEASVTKQKLDSLLRVIKDKDHVLSRLLEKVDSSAIDLSLIFPGMTGLKSRKGRTTVREAQKHVPGMSEFDHEKWLNGFDNGSPYAGFDEMGMSSLVTGCERCPKHTVKQHCDWLKRLPTDDGQSTATTPDSKSTTKRKVLKASSNKGSSDTESDFERQPTPPHLKPNNLKPKRPARSNSTDDSETSDGVESRPIKKAKLGKLGAGNTRKTKSPVSEMASSPPAYQSSSKQSDNGEGTAGVENTDRQDPASDADTETASEDDSLNPKDTPPPRSQQTMSNNRKLGKLSNKQPSASSSRSTSPGKQAQRQTSSSKARQEPGNSKSTPEHDSNSTVAAAIDADRTNTTTSTDTSKTKTRSNDKQNPPTPSKPAPSKDLPLTPSRRLGRLGRNQSTNSASASASASESPSHRPKHSTITTNSPSPPKPTSKTADNDSDSDTATATASSSSDNDDDGPEKHTDTKPKTSTSPQPPSNHPESSPVPVPEPEPQKEETLEEKANRRREELKRKIGTGGAAGTRKMRKF